MSLESLTGLEGSGTEKDPYQIHDREELALGGIYNGQAQELVAAGTANGGEMQYSLSEDGPYSTNIPTGIEADTYLVWYRVTGDRNHNDIGPWSVPATISEDDPNKPDKPNKPDNLDGPGIPSGTPSSSYPPIPRRGITMASTTASKMA